MSKTKAYDADRIVVSTLGIGWNDDVNYYYSSGNWVYFRRSFTGIFESSYAGRVRLTVKEALPHSKDLLQWFALQQNLPPIPEAEEKELGAFWARLIGDDDLGDQLLKPLRDLRADPDQIIARLQNLAERLPAQISQEDRDKLQQAIAAVHIDSPQPSVQEIFEQITGKEINEQISLQSPEARSWLEQFLVWLVQYPERENKLGNRMRGYLWEHVQHDHRHYLLFGQTDDIPPRSWIEASWKYIQKFRCNFGIFVSEAMLYPTVTVIGTPDVPVAVTREEEKFLREYLPRPSSFRFERLWVRTAAELKALFDDRIEKKIRFVGGDVGPYAPWTSDQKS